MGVGIIGCVTTPFKHLLATTPINIESIKTTIMEGTFIIKNGFFTVIQLAGLTCKDTVILDPHRVDPTEFVDCGTRVIGEFKHSAN